MDNIIELKIDDTVYKVDTSHVTPREGHIIIEEPLEYKGIAVSLPHIPSFAGSKISFKDNGKLTDRGLERIKEIIPKRLSYLTAINSIDANNFYKNFWDEYGRKKYNALIKQTKKLNSLNKINKDLKKKMKTDSFLEDVERTMLYSLIAKERKDTDNKIQSIIREASEIISSVFKKETGIDFIAYDERNEIIKKCNLFDIDQTY